jgi:hypothetical protein
MTTMARAPTSTSKSTGAAKPAGKATAKADGPTVTEVAKAFTAMLKAGDHLAAAQKFNAPGIVSLEAMEGPMARVEGAVALKAKSDWWYADHTVHAASAMGPYVNGNQFAVNFDLDVTAKATGQRMCMLEVGLYTVQHGKIIEERFFY